MAASAEELGSKWVDGAAAARAGYFLSDNDSHAFPNTFAADLRVGSIAAADGNGDRLDGLIIEYPDGSGLGLRRLRSWCVGLFLSAVFPAGCILTRLALILAALNS